MAKNTKGAAEMTSAEARLKAFRERMKAKGLHGGGSPYLNIAVDGGFFAGSFVKTYERKSTKFKGMRTIFVFDISEGYGKHRDGLGDVKPGQYEVELGGNANKRLEDAKPGLEVGIYFKGKKEVPGFKMPLKQYEIYTGEQE